MEEGILGCDHLLDVISVPQIYTLEVWIETINLDKSKIKIPEPPPTTKTKSTETTGKADDGSESGEDIGRARRYSIGSEDYLLPNGLKPLRVRYNAFDMKEVSILPVEFDVLQFILLHECENESIDSDSKPSNETLGDNIPTDGSENAGESIKTNDNPNKKFEKKGPPNKVTQKSESSNKSGSGGPSNKSGQTDQTTSENDDLKSNSQDDLLFHLDEVLEFMNEDLFVPKSETKMKRGASATFTKPPYDVIYSLQRGKLILTVDRYGGKYGDEGDPIGEAAINIPQNWVETVLRVANEPSLAPVKMKISDNIPIYDKSGVEIGRIEFIMKFHCLSGCAVSYTMPTQLGLYITIMDIIDPKTPCHKPIVCKNINYQSMMKKSLIDDYELMFKPSCTTSLRPNY